MAIRCFIATKKDIENSKKRMEAPKGKFVLGKPIDDPTVNILDMIHFKPWEIEAFGKMREYRY